MLRCRALLGIGLAVTLFRKRIGRWHHLEYLRRSHRSVAYQKAYLRRWDFRAEGFVALVIGVGTILMGLVCLAGRR